MRRMVKGLLAYSQVENSSRALEPVDCEQILDETLDVLRREIEESDAVVTHDPLPTVVGDGAQLRLVFQNLIDNAIKFQDEGTPRVHVQAEREGDTWKFSVHDNGIGIKPIYADHIFDIFSRLHNYEEYPGAGTGLAICKRILERHGGDIWVESKHGTGSVFYFTLPAKRKAI